MADSPKGPQHPNHGSIAHGTLSGYEDGCRGSCCSSEPKELKELKNAREQDARDKGIG